MHGVAAGKFNELFSVIINKVRSSEKKLLKRDFMK